MARAHACGLKTYQPTLSSIEQFLEIEMKPLSELEIGLLKTILKDARKSIKSEQDFFVCVAIESQQHKHGHKATKYLRKWVTQMLDGHGTLEGWLLNHRSHFPYLRNSKAHRVQWINWMIAQLDAELVGRQGSAAQTV
jgi:hypothetical protein